MDNQNKPLEDIANQLKNIADEIKNAPRKFVKNQLQFSFAYILVLLAFIALIIFISNTNQ